MGNYSGGVNTTGSPPLLPLPAQDILRDAIKRMIDAPTLDAMTEIARKTIKQLEGRQLAT